MICHLSYKMQNANNKICFLHYFRNPSDADADRRITTRAVDGCLSLDLLPAGTRDGVLDRVVLLRED